MYERAESNGELTLRELIDQTIVDYERTETELSEIGVLVKQSAAEVERLAQHNTRVSNQIRQLHTNFDTIPREDIKESYEALINAQLRLFTMRGQLEKLQSDYRNLERLAEFQRRLIETTEGVEELPGVRKRVRDQSDVVRVIQTEEASRQSLVRRMHDGPASSLSNFILQAEICQRYFDIDPVRARTELNVLKGSAATTFAAVKDFIFDLRPMMLDDLGVAPTLRRYAESFEDKHDIEVSMTVTGTERRLPGHIEVAIFRGVQELLNNAVFHGRATHIMVLLDITVDNVHLIVEDDGEGFDATDILDGGRGQSNIGLPLLNDRVEMLGGELNIQSNIGQGTRIEFSIPFEAESYDI